MGTYTFKWPHAGEQVYVTGTFDDWTKSIKLDKVGDVFEKEVTFPDQVEKIYYKFVVDGDWTVNQAAPKENDPNGIENNFLTPESLVKSAPAETAFISSVGPESTTAALLKDVPVEKKEETTGEPKVEAKEETKDEPTAESSAAATADMPAKGENDAVPGAFPETPATDLDKEFKVSPLPATEGGVNPIELAPGEPIPKSITSQDINAHVKLDPESYEKADTLPGVSDVAALLPPVSSTMIPESSLPIAGANDVTINSVGPSATTVALAGEVPLEPRAPAIVKESQEKAGVDPEASAVGEEVKEKAQVEAELLQKVPEAPSTAEGTAGKGTDKAEADKTVAETVTETAAGLSATAVATAVAAKDAVVEQATAAAAQLPDAVKQNLPESVQNAIAPAAKEEIRQEVSPEVPAEVKESIKEAGKSPEAAANTAAVEEKKVIEAELLKEVPAAPAVGEESKKADEAAEPKKAEEATAAKPAETTAVAKPAETTAAAAAAEAKPATNGSTNDASATAAKTTAGTPASKPAEAVAPTTPDKKKKGRLSMMISKIKHKVSSAHK
ncbi:hypothetical protein MAPG_11113 [Magnaporthiopsis poae ATCC 64411]|uniref:AMP-activated protein kinase glycogen-binding domain-containing protein n=1 Tax=Magnaporthiopsis poae (strain ATCC 64411 / 73-15) TaxID=644358 RepID=A0A0C4EEE1_MAGP6|nr:hypothetical protein MAPG_11113 [Magnaporthiopsis poae ATCC 64411]